MAEPTLCPINPACDARLRALEQRMERGDVRFDEQADIKEELKALRQVVNDLVVALNKAQGVINAIKWLSVVAAGFAGLWALVGKH